MHRNDRNFLLAMLLFLPLIAVAVGGCVAEIQFDRNVTGRLKRAADANTVETAARELEAVIVFAKSNGMTGGNTSILWDVPSNDVGFWYDNLVASFNELTAIPSNASQLDKTNVLMKLRESLMDHGEKGDSVTHPDYLKYYPNQFAWIFAFGVSLLLAGIGGLWISSNH